MAIIFSGEKFRLKCFCRKSEKKLLKLFPGLLQSLSNNTKFGIWNPDFGIWNFNIDIIYNLSLSAASIAL